MLLRPARRSTTFVAAALATAALGAGGTALAQTVTGSGTPTDIQVTAAPTLNAGATAPFDAPAVKAVRQGKAIPKGYVLIGFRVQVHRGTKMAGAALRFQCPSGKHLRSFGTVGHAGFSSTNGADYVGQSITYAMSTPGMRTADGKSLTDADGILYAVCR